MNAIDLVVWGGAWTLLARWVRTAEPRAVVALGALIGVGLLNKLGIATFAAALLLTIPLTRLRERLRAPARMRKFI